ncbi:MAG: MFS transporter, partial [Sphingobium sp.]
PADVRSSAQGLFNLLILGVGMVVASFVFPELMTRLSIVPGDLHTVDYQTLFLVPSGLALLGALLLAFAFRPPWERPVEGVATPATAH